MSARIVRDAITAILNGEIGREDFVSEPIVLGTEEMIEEVVQDFALWTISSWCPPHRGTVLFKGGTLLARVYLGYHRFSHDLDFTWVPSEGLELYSQMSRKGIRRYCNELIESLGRFLEERCAETEILDFRFGRGYVKYGCNSRMVTFTVFAPVASDRKKGVKIQMRFVDVVVDKPVIVVPRSIMSRVIERKLGRYLPIPRVLAYSIREIASEKLRAMVMRIGIAKYGIRSILKDVYDLYHIYQRHGLSPRDVVGDAIRKTSFIDELEGRYSTHYIDLLSEEALVAIAEFGLGWDVVASPQFRAFHRDLVEAINIILSAVPPRRDRASRDTALV